MMIEDFEDTIGWIGCGLTTCFFIPQLWPFIRIIQKKSYFEDTPGVFISICYINCFFWMIYGDMIFSDPVKISNLIACFICFIDMIIYIIYEIKKYTLDAILNLLILFMGSWSVYKYLTIEIDDDKIVGNICMVTSIFLYSYFGYIIYKVIKEKNFLLIHFTTTSIYFVSSIIWLVYGIITKDLYMVCPHIVGIILSLMHIVIYLNYEKRYPIISTSDAEGPGIVEIKKDEDFKNTEDNNNNKEKPVVEIINRFDN